jgi:hypothetical protein
MTDTLQDTDRPTREAAMVALTHDLAEIVTPHAGTRLNVRLEGRWITTGREVGTDQGYREWRLRVTSEEGGPNQEELEAIFQVLDGYQSTEAGCGLYAGIQNDGLEIAFVA